MRLPERSAEASEAPAGCEPRWLRLVAVLVLAAFCGVPGGADVGGGSPTALVGAEALHDRGITGRGVTIAVIGGGLACAPEILRAVDGHDRLLAVFDADSGELLEPPSVAAGCSEGEPASRLLETMVSSRRDPEGSYGGVAPGADLVLVRAFGPDGLGSPGAVARAIDWVVANRQRYGVRVLPLPLAAAPGAALGQGEMSRAVADAWAAGIVVVAAAGNDGPAPMSVTAPGSLPGVITVGASAVAEGQAVVPSYSGSGPTLDGFVKPEVVAPTGQFEVESLEPLDHKVRRLSAGTAVAAAVTSGVVALALEASPWLTPDEVKLRLLLGARPVVAADGAAASWLRQGAGMIDAFATAMGVAAIGADEVRNGGGLGWPDDIAADLVWSGGADRGMNWSAGSARGITWSELEARGMTWSDGAVRWLADPGGADRGLVWSE